MQIAAKIHPTRRRDVARVDRPAAHSAATRLAVDEATPATVAATLGARRTGARDRRRIGTWHHLQRGHRQNPSPRHRPFVTLRRRAGRRYADKTRAVDRPLRGHRVTYWFRKGPLPAWIVSARPHIEITRADARIPRRQRRSLFELSEDSCRWPVGDPRSSPFFFCGAPRLRNRPYCAEHCARAYRHPRAPPRGAAPLRHPARPRNPSRTGEETAVPTRPLESQG